MKTLVLVGSGEFTESMLKIDNYLIEKIRKNPTSPRLRGAGKINVAIIPTAAVPDDKQEVWIEDGVKHFKKLGANPFGLNIVKQKDANSVSILKKLKTADIIYFSGGHPGFLLETFKDTEAWNVILNLYQQGIILAGSSAGAMIFGNYVLANAQESFDRGIEPIWVKGFNLVPYTIFPHYDWVQKNKQELFKKVLDSAPKYVRESWMGIDEDTALIISDNKKVELYGKGNLIIQSENKSFNYHSGHKFLI